MTIALLVCSCNRGQIGKALTDLDEVIHQSDVYEREFIAKADDIKRHYRDAETEELKWALADSLYQMYYCNNLDSSLFYLGRMKLHAVSAQQKLRTRMSELTISMVRMNNEESLEGFHNLDTAALLIFFLIFIIFDKTLFLKCSKYGETNEAHDQQYKTAG